MRQLAAAEAIVVSRGERGIAMGIALALGVLAFAWHAGAVHAATYKWVDEKGVIHYTDKVPPEAVNRGNVELSRDGVPVRKLDPALTPEQRRAREQEEDRKRQLAKQQEETARRDRALLASYASESEIDLAKARAVSTIDAVLQSTNAYTEQLNKRRVELTAKMATFKNRPVPAVLERELESLDAELARQAAVIEAKRRETASVTAKYDGDKARYRELTAARPSSEVATGNGLSQASSRK